jgi:hypothetical protein
VLRVLEVFFAWLEVKGQYKLPAAYRFSPTTKAQLEVVLAVGASELSGLSGQLRLTLKFEEEETLCTCNDHPLVTAEVRSVPPRMTAACTQLFP